ncbi:hypothetical protein SVAN01_08869 [Stagonosporopsis vannaccii]|nr:hypothetical protein SVAN01_08869 [Stagonosporopsis vannaccii]
MQQTSRILEIRPSRQRRQPARTRSVPSVPCEAATAVARSRTTLPTELWYAASRRPQWPRVYRYTSGVVYSREGPRCFATPTSAVPVPCLSSAWVKPLQLSFSCRSRLEKSISAPRGREPQESFALQFESESRH